MTTERREMEAKGDFCQRNRDIHPAALIPEYKTSVLRSLRKALLSLQHSLSEVTGPGFGHLNLWIVARGINIGLHTRMYFADEAAANAEDPVLRLIWHEGRRKTLIAQRTTEHGQAVYRFDIHLQGDDETVFFDV